MENISMKITTIRFYDGAKERISRLGLSMLFLEVQQIIFETKVDILEEHESNGAAVIRERLDAAFKSKGEWTLSKSGDIDWIKRIRYNSTVLARMGVEIQVSSRSDQLTRDLVHLRNSLREGKIDAGVVIVPSDRFQSFLTDRTPSLKDAIRIFEDEFKEAQEYPITVIAIEHDGVGDALPKKKTNLGKGKKGR
jgi:hypothetical protein